MKRMCFAHAHKQADAQQKGAHLEERAEQIARQSDTLLWQRGEGGGGGGGGGGRGEEGGGGEGGGGGVQWSTLRHLKNENEKKKKNGEKILEDFCRHVFEQRCCCGHIFSR